MSKILRWTVTHHTKVIQEATDVFQKKNESFRLSSKERNVVCWKCSDHKVALEYEGNKLNKVRKACCSISTSKRGERVEGKKRKILESEVSPVTSQGKMRMTF